MAAMASTAAPRKRRISHAVAARSSVPKRAAAQRVAVHSNDDEEEMENERLRLEASDGDDVSADGDANLTSGLASAARWALPQFRRWHRATLSQ